MVDAAMSHRITAQASASARYGFDRNLGTHNAQASIT